MRTRSKSFYLQSKKTISQSTHDVEQSSSLPESMQELPQKKMKWSDERLKLSYVPKKLIGRTSQAQQIYEFIQNCLLNRINRKVLYISGVPGSGKTASTIQIINQIKRQVKKVDFCYINSLTLKKPVDIYRLIYSHLQSKFKDENKKGSKSSDIQRLLPKIQENHIIVIDEVDFLMTKDQSIFYNLFQWSSQITTKLGYILISNTFDFPEKLNTKVSSRMGDNKMYFRPYTQEEIKDVIVDRLADCPYFSSGAIVYASKKLATFSSDIRVILRILQDSIAEHIKLKRSGQIQVKHIAKLWDQKLQKENAKACLDSLHQKIIDYVKKQGGNCISLRLYQVLRQQGVNQGSMMILLKELEQMGFVELKEVYQSPFRCHRIKYIFQE